MRVSDINISASSFVGVTDTAHAVLDVLHRHMPDVACCVAFEDLANYRLSIVAARGDLPLTPQSDGEVGQTATSAPPSPGQARVDDPFRDLLQFRRQVEIASYARVSLGARNGEQQAMLYAIARTPERFGADEMRMIEVMGRVIANELVREQTYADLLRREKMLVEANGRLRAHATTDPVTRVANRRSFDELLRREWKLCARGTIGSYLMVVDLDDFKLVNDLYGHSVGDRTLRDAAVALVASGRETDVIGRLGGDEFGVILVGCESPEAATEYRDRARATFAQTMLNRQIAIGFSAGFYPLVDASSPEQALELADQAMYWHKRQRSARPDRPRLRPASPRGGAPQRPPPPNS